MDTLMRKTFRTIVNIGGLAENSRVLPSENDDEDDSLELEACRALLAEKNREITRLREKLSREIIKNRSCMLEIDKSTSYDYKFDGMRKPTAAQRELRFREIESGVIPTTREEPKRATAIVFDCGTNVTKAILFAFDSNAECTIKIRELNLKDGSKIEGMIDYIERGTSCESVVKMFSEIYLKGCHIIEDDVNERIDFCIVGASAWARKLYRDDTINHKKNALMHALGKNGFYPCIFSQRDESRFELLSTIFAFSTAQNLRMVPRHLMLGGFLASGGGSCQYTFFNGGSRRRRSRDGEKLDAVMRTPFVSLNVEVGNREGIRVFLNAVKAYPGDREAPIRGLRDWLSQTRRLVECETKRSPTFMRKSGFILCISAQYFAAVEMSRYLKDCDNLFGHLNNADNEAATIKASRAIACANKYVEAKIEEWQHMTEERIKELTSSTDKRRNLKAWARGLANVSLCSLLWSCYFNDDADLCFKRNWSFGAEQISYRNTWSTGWFIEMLQSKKGIKMSNAFPHMKSILEEFDRSRAIRKKRVVDFRLNHSKVAFCVNDMVASQIFIVPQMADHHHFLASTCSEEVDTWMKAIDDELTSSSSSSLREFEHRIKDKVSIERKLNSVIASHLRHHSHRFADGSYAPLECELMRGVQDGLRYTFVIDLNMYYQGVKIIESALLSRKCTIEGRNYWRNPNEDEESQETMYMGLNLTVHTPSHPRAFHFKDDRYPFEIQIHTPESYALKTDVSDDLYEFIRTENVPVRRRELETRLCTLWRALCVPQHDSFTPSHFALYRGCDETRSVFSHHRLIYGRPSA